MIPILRNRSRVARAQAFERLVRPHVATLFRSACHFTRSRTDAEDLVQEVLVKAYIRLSQIEQMSNLRGWLLRVLYREFVDARRRANRRTRYEGDCARSAATHDVGLASANDEPCATLETERASVDVHHVLRQLAPEQRALVTLHFLEGYTLEQLTEIFDSPVGTLKSRLHRIRAELRTMLDTEPFVTSGRC